MVIISDEVYMPREDSWQLNEAVEQFAAGKVLEIGIGSGIQILTAAEMESTSHCVGVDINPKAINHTINELNKKIKEGLIPENKVEILKSNMFEKLDRLVGTEISHKFDTIIFNPPYLPDHPDIKDMALDGGKKGYELTKDFIDQVNEFLSPTGIILLLFSSHTKKDKVDQFLNENCFTFSEISQNTMPDNEILYVYKITKSLLLRELEQKGVTGVKKLAQGKRGFVYTGIYNHQKISIKYQRPDTKAQNSLQNEINVLTYFHNEGLDFIPEIIFTGHDYFAYEFIEGDLLVPFTESNTKTNIIQALKTLLSQMYILDTLGYNKMEMNHPQKHIFIKTIKKKIFDEKTNHVKVVGKEFEIKLIDYERCKITKSPKNVTQFVQFITSTKYLENLHSKKLTIDKDKVRELANNYKKERNEKNFKLILKQIK